MRAIQFFILLILLLVFLQDMKSRAVYWVLFPVLAVLFLITDFITRTFNDSYPAVLFNFLFIGLQLLIITLWFSLKEKRWTNVTIQLLGWGDILLITCTAFYLSSLNFLLFNVISLILVLITWIIWQYFAESKSKQVPLAGLQALYLGVFLSMDWFVFHFDVASDDYWLLHYFIK